MDSSRPLESSSSNRDRMCANRSGRRGSNMRMASVGPGVDFPPLVRFMGLIVVAARVVLAGVFAVAAVAKVTSRERSQQTLIDFGVPVTFAPPLSVLLPLAEMAVAIALLSTPLAVYGAVGGLVLLVLFSAAVAANLLRGKRPDCNCFGQLTASPVGWTTLARNAVLAAIAFFALGAGDAATDADVLSTLGGVVATSLSLAVAALIGLSVIIVEAFFIRQL